jgi:hypothetical protein
VKEKLFSFKTVATRAFFRIAIAGVAHVNTRKRTVVARTVVLAFGYGATDALVCFFFLHHKNFLLISVGTVCAKCFYIIDIFENFL